MDDKQQPLPPGLRFGKLRDWVHLCIDMQLMFAEPTAWQTPWLNRILPQVVRLVEREPARSLFTRFVPPASPEEVGGTWQRYYRRWPEMTLQRLDAGLVELVPALARFVPPARMLDKPVYSPWHDGRLHRQLQADRINTLVISGAETEVCVLAAVMGGIDHGYRIVLVTDAICSSADPTHDAMLEIYHSRYGMQVETVTTEEVLAEG